MGSRKDQTPFAKLTGRTPRVVVVVFGLAIMMLVVLSQRCSLPAVLTAHGPMTVTFRPIPAGRFLRDVLLTKLDLQTFQTNCGDLLESEGNEALSMDVVRLGGVECDGCSDFDFEVEMMQGDDGITTFMFKADGMLSISVYGHSISRLSPNPDEPRRCLGSVGKNSISMKMYGSQAMSTESVSELSYQGRLSVAHDPQLSLTYHVWSDLISWPQKFMPDIRLRATLACLARECMHLNVSQSGPRLSMRGKVEKLHGGPESAQVDLRPTLFEVIAQLRGGLYVGLILALIAWVLPKLTRRFKE